MMAAALCLVLWATRALAGEPAAKPADAKVRIGVYDSRAIVVAFFGSEAFKASDGKELADKKAEYDKAKAEGNQARVAELEAWGKALQIRLHKQGFSTAPVDDILKHVKDKMPEIAKSAGVGRLTVAWACRSDSPASRLSTASGMPSPPSARPAHPNSFSIVS